MSAHYRKQLNFTFEGLDHAAAALERIHSLVLRLDEVESDGPSGEAEAACRRREGVRRRPRRRPEHPRGAGRRPQPRERSATRSWRGRVDARGRRAGHGRASRRWTPSSACSSRGETADAPRSRPCFDERQDARKRRDFQPPMRRGRSLEALGIVLEDTPRGPGGGGRADGPPRARSRACAAASPGRTSRPPSEPRGPRGPGPQLPMPLRGDRHRGPRARRRPWSSSRSRSAAREPMAADSRR